MHYNVKTIRTGFITLTILLLAGFIMAGPGHPQNVGAQTNFQAVVQDSFSFNHVMVRITPSQDSCGDRVDLQLFSSAQDIDIVIYDDVTEVGDQRFNATNKLVEALDKSSTTGGDLSFQLPSPVRLTENDPVYVAISTLPSALSADDAMSDSGQSYISYDGINWRESELAFDIRLETIVCGPDVPIGPVATNTPFVPTPTETSLPTSTPIPTAAPDEPTYTPTATVAAQAVCEAPSVRTQVAASSLDREEQATPLWSALLDSERFSPSTFQKQPLLDFYLVQSHGQLQRVDLSQQSVAPAKLDMPTQVEPNITGSLLLPDGDPAAYFSLSIYEVDREDNAYGDPVFIGETDGDGLLSAYLINGNYLLRVEPPLKGSNGLPIDGIETLEHLFEVSASGETELGQLTLPATAKVIQGQIVHTDGTLISGTRVDAFNVNTGQYVYTYPDSNGTFVLNVGGGLWQLSLLPVVGVTWVSVDVRQEVQFQRDDSVETVDDLIFNVRPADAMMIGRVSGPAGEALTSDTLEVFGLNFNARFDLFDTVTERYAFGFLDATGAVTIPLSSGIYEGSIWIDNALYPQFTGRSLDDLIQVTTGVVNVGTIRLVENDSIVRGIVSNSDGVPIPNIPINLWQETGQSRTGITDENGIYELVVPRGKWWVRPAPQASQAQLFTGKSQQVALDATAPTQVDFSLEPSAGHLSGTLVDNQERLLGDVDAYVYVRRDNDSKPVVSVPVESGRFSVKIPYGDLRVGLFLGPDSPYVLPEEVVPEIVSERTTASTAILNNLDNLFDLSLANRDQAFFIQSATSDRSVKLQVIPANAKVQGQLQDIDGLSVTGMAGDVIAIEQGRPQNWKRSAINPEDGSYGLNLIAGTWDLVYQLAVNEDDTTVVPNPERPTTVVAEAETTITQDLAVTKLELIAKGIVVDENGSTVPNALVLVRMDSYESNVRSDENGEFTLFTPVTESEIEAAESDGKGRRTASAGSAPRGGSSNRHPRQFTLPPDLPSEIVVIESDDVEEIRVVLRSSNAYLTGQVLDLDQQPVEGAKVSGVNTKDAQVFSIVTDANGCFAAPVKTDGEYEWRITARYQDRDGILMESQFTMGGDALPLNQAQAASASPLGMANLPVDSGIAMQYKGTIPQPETHDFSVESGWSHTMPDGFTIEIPPNAINTNESDVRVQLIPKYRLNETYLHNLTGYGYKISLSDSSGRAILNEFRSNVLLTLGYEEDSVASEERLIVAHEANDQWLKEKQVFQNQEDNTFSVSIQKPGVYAVLQPNAIPELDETVEVPTSSLAPASLTGNVEANMEIIAADEQAIWTIRVTNAGELAAEGVVLIAQLPSDTQITDSSLADGWTEQDMPAYRLELGTIEGGKSVSELFAVNLSADSNLTTILEPHFLLQNAASADGINISAGLGNNVDVNRVPTASPEETGNLLIEHYIYLPVITR